MLRGKILPVKARIPNRMSKIEKDGEQKQPFNRQPSICSQVITCTLIVLLAMLRLIALDFRQLTLSTATKEAGGHLPPRHADAHLQVSAGF